MDWVHLHLALNHVPVVGTPFLLALLLWGWFRGSAEIVRLSLGWTLLFSAVSIALKFTGDFAVEAAGPRLDTVRGLVHAHEQSADQAATAIFLNGIAAGVALFTGRRGQPVARWALALSAALGLASCVLLARTANLGGKVSHPSLRATAALPAMPSAAA